MVKFREMLKRHNIQLPRGVSAGLSNEAMERMVAMTMRMERPLTNALGEGWRDILTREKIIDLYSRM